MTPPRLTEKLVLEDELRSPDGAGGFLIQWQTIGTVWASISGAARPR